MSIIKIRHWSFILHDEQYSAYTIGIEIQTIVLSMYIMFDYEMSVNVFDDRRINFFMMI